MVTDETRMRYTLKLEYTKGVECEVKILWNAEQHSECGKLLDAIKGIEGLEITDGKVQQVRGKAKGKKKGVAPKLAAS